MVAVKGKTIKKVIVLGSGGLSIGQAGEFDYSGSQAIKALKQEGMRTVLVNPNIATIQTSKNLADEVYFLPVNAEFVEKIIAKERPDGILLAFGGQTALNCGVELHKAGVLKKFGVRVLGTPIETIIETEDKGLFAKALGRIGVKTPRSIAASSVADGLRAGREIGFPVIVRSSYALGGLGSGFCNNARELRTLLKQSLAQAPQVLVEESLQGWKEVEYEVMRDASDNCVTICNMENFDPLGIHTGESIVVAPSQTLTDREYHSLRRISIDLVRSLGIIGECNVQFALDPCSEDYRVIEVNARLSRSSALASKATGYPIAFIAAKLALGQRLTEIPNPVTRTTKAFFEPALDYVVVKMPKWDVDKFKGAEKRIGSSMKSVGEAMAIGRKFEEALQKAVRMINPGAAGLPDEKTVFGNLDDALRNPTDKRIFAIARALERGWSVDEVFRSTKIDKWFLHKIKNIVEINRKLARAGKASKAVSKELLVEAKQHGFSDKQIAKRVFGRDDFASAMRVRSLRKRLGVVPVVKRIDTLAAEYPCKTNYLYFTYNGVSDELKRGKNGRNGKNGRRRKNKSVVVLGGGAYRIGSSVEFDWCCVECVKTLRRCKIPAAVVNYNPETVSTDYDESDRLYFDELSLERVLDVCDEENPRGVVVSFGGQIPNNLALPLAKCGVRVLGTPASVIDEVEDRHKFSKILERLGVDQPEWQESSSLREVKEFCARVGYPVLIRPSYVLSGTAMSVAYDESDLTKFLKEAALVSEEHPVVVTKFVTDAKEIDFDAVAQGGDLKAYAISEHIENAGVHSGDATLVTPAQKLYVETLKRVKKISRMIIRRLNVTGPVNIQFLAKDNRVKIIECNLRASRSFPFVSKVYDVDFVELATRAILGEKIGFADTKAFDLDYVGVKAPQFSFTRLRGADPVLGVEMASTGEVACLGEDVREAFLKALLSTGFALPKPPRKTVLLSTGDVKQKTRLIDAVKTLARNGYSLYATGGTARFYAKHGIRTRVVRWPDEAAPNCLDYLKRRKIGLVINIPKSNESRELSNDYFIRRTAADFSVPLITNAQCAALFADALSEYDESGLAVKSWREYRESSDK
ncbi:MAG: carbamoyl-phosphate synthase (glutamine-hydrolyzing) large subunit [Candidatus Micrarchaeota archaeon]